MVCQRSDTWKYTHLYSKSVIGPTRVFNPTTPQWKKDRNSVDQETHTQHTIDLSDQIYYLDWEEYSEVNYEEVSYDGNNTDWNGGTTYVLGTGKNKHQQEYKIDKIMHQRSLSKESVFRKSYIR